MEAFELAASIRYLDDIKLRTFTGDPKTIQNYEAGLALNSLKVSKEITPSIFNSLEKACSNLNLDLNKVNAYVTSSPEIQAGCMSFSKESCVITVTSATINLMNFDEIQFIFGHELGHFLLSHNIEEIEMQDSKEGYIKKRAQEISVDRVGLLACKDIDAATRAVVKSLSGLDEKYIKFDIKAFLNQLDEDLVKNEKTGQFSSHPSFILRAKALMRFSLSDPYLQLAEGISGTHLIEIDKLIQEDLNTYIDRDLRLDIKEAKELILFWGYAYAYVKNGSFTKENQSNLESKFGPNMKEKLINMITGLSTKEVIKVVKIKFINSINNYKVVAPNIAKKELNLMILEIEKDTNQKEFFNEILQEV